MPNGNNNKKNGDSGGDNENDKDNTADEEIIIPDDEDIIEENHSPTQVSEPKNDNTKTQIKHKPTKNTPPQKDEQILPNEIKTNTVSPKEESQQKIDNIKKRVMKPPMHRDKNQQKEDSEQPQPPQNPPNKQTQQKEIDPDILEIDNIRNAILFQERKEAEMKKIVEQEQEEEMQQEEEEVIIQLTDGAYKVLPSKDEIFSVFCMKCNRYTQNQTLVKAINLKKTLERYGCVCKEQKAFEITITKILIRDAEKSDIKIKPFEQAYLDQLFKKFTMPKLIGVQKIKPKTQQQPQNP